MFSDFKEPSGACSPGHFFLGGASVFAPAEGFALGYIGLLNVTEQFYADDTIYIMQEK